VAQKRCCRRLSTPAPSSDSNDAQGSTNKRPAVKNLIAQQLKDLDQEANVVKRTKELTVNTFKEQLQERLRRCMDKEKWTWTREQLQKLEASYNRLNTREQATFQKAFAHILRDEEPSGKLNLDCLSREDLCAMYLFIHEKLVVRDEVFGPLRAFRKQRVNPITLQTEYLATWSYYPGTTWLTGDTLKEEWRHKLHAYLRSQEARRKKRDERSGMEGEDKSIRSDSIDSEDDQSVGHGQSPAGDLGGRSLEEALMLDTLGENWHD